MTPSELMQSFASWLDSRDSDEWARKAFGLLAISVTFVVSIYVLIQLYRADFSTARLVISAVFMWGGMALGGLTGLLIVRWTHR